MHKKDFVPALLMSASSTKQSKKGGEGEGESVEKYVYSADPYICKRLVSDEVGKRKGKQDTSFTWPCEGTYIEILSSLTRMKTITL